MNQILYISFGNKSNNQLTKSIESVKKLDINYYLINIINESTELQETKEITNNTIKSRYYKTQLNKFQIDKNLYLDSDTLVNHKDINIYFDLLDSFDLVICKSTNQDKDSFWHVGELERNYTIDQIGFNPLQYQCGVFSWKACNAVDKFFKVWHDEWNIFKGQDQAAFVRALYKCPIRIAILSNVFNGGVVVTHNFGSIR